MENKEKKLDEFTQKIFNETSLETPSFDFTDEVMANLPEIHSAKRIKTKTSVKKIKYEPLISKSGWGMIAAFVAILLISAHFSSAVKASGVMIDKWSRLKSVFNFSVEMPNFDILNTDVLAISIALFTAYFLLEIFLLNNWMNKKSFAR
ncbi:hypothetical protein INR75_17950 [Zunongwangia sp. SCSIO 43204]|uniref:hypothetical protein n=1 Tax=Zunongwangia sp. SCSIO 43204 TaxID=2779359 RepID=UPI001CA912E7|nr:hypothetical protein [Zunongwangia sp. SCSIO 43204]UAB84029.1 hypothetical protein INR75_17950 [Zunongwangia sp. SCSIO 43204]